MRKMTQSDIMGLAAEANLWVTSDERLDAVKKFAALVAAAEREECLQAVGDLIRKHRDEEDGEPEGYPDIFDAVEAIRARGQE